MPFGVQYEFQPQVVTPRSLRTSSVIRHLGQWAKLPEEGAIAGMKVVTCQYCVRHTDGYRIQEVTWYGAALNTLTCTTSMKVFILESPRPREQSRPPTTGLASWQSEGQPIPRAASHPALQKSSNPFQPVEQHKWRTACRYVIIESRI